MSSQFFITLLNPGIGLLLASAFLLLWMHQRERTYVALASASYVFLALGFLIRDVGETLTFGIQHIPINLSFIAAANLMTAAVIQRYGRTPPWRAMALFSLLGTIGLCWFLLAQPSLVGRIFVVNLALGAILALIVVQIWNVKRTHLADHLLFCCAILSVANYLVRPALIIHFADGYALYANYDGFQESLYWTTVQFTTALLAIMFALNLMVAVAVDLIRDLKQQAELDQLSGLLNRRGFETVADATLKTCADQGQQVALMIADLDHFKQINDTYGHAVGDSVIAAFGASIQKHGTRGMVAGRIGGEEFAILLPGAGANVARRMAETIILRMKDECAASLPHGLAPTVSIGLTISEAGALLSQLLGAADAALYEAKRMGRNRVQLYSPGPLLVTERYDVRPPHSDPLSAASGK